MVRGTRLRNGYSLMELMVSVAVMGFVLLYLMRTFTAQHQTYVMMDEVTEAQQSLRAISSVLEREVRTAGFMVDQAGAVCGIDAVNGPDTLFVSDASALDPTNSIQAALGARLAAGSTPALGSRNLNFTAGDTVVLDGQPSYDTDNNGVNDSDFNLGAGVIVYDRTNPARGTSCGIVTAVAPPGSITVNFLTGNLGAGAAGQLVAVPAHVYQVNATAQLLRDGLVLAEDVEDLQVAAFFDNNKNGQVDVGENPGIAGTNYVASAQNNIFLRELRLNFVVRTRGTDTGFTQGQFQVTENRVAPAATPQDSNLRRRILTTTVRVRNIGNRGLMS